MCRGVYVCGGGYMCVEAGCVRGGSVCAETGVCAQGVRVRVKSCVCGGGRVGGRTPACEERPVRRAPCRPPCPRRRRLPGAGPADALRLERARGGRGGGAGPRGGWRPVPGARPSARRRAD